MATNDFAHFRGTRINTPEIQGVLKANRDDMIATLKAEFGEKLAERADWAKSTLVKDSVHPLLNRPFSELFEFRTSRKGYPQLVLFPWNNDPRSGDMAANPAGAISALVEAFAYRKYDWKLSEDEHSRIFDPERIHDPQVKSIKLQTPDGGFWWTSYSWSNRNFQITKMGGDNRKFWLAKHMELNALLEAIEKGVRYHVVLTRDWQEDKAKRQIFGRLNMTVEAAIAEKAADGRKADENRSVAYRVGSYHAGKTTAATPGAVIVAGIDLSKLKEGETKNVSYISKISGEKMTIPVTAGNSPMLRSIEKGIADGTVFTIEE